MPEAGGGSSTYAPMAMDGADGGSASDNEAALAIMKQKAKRFEFLFGAVAAILVMWIGSAIFSSPPPAPPAAADGASSGTAGAGTAARGAAPAPPSRWVAPVAISSELRVWDPEAVECKRTRNLPLLVIHGCMLTDCLCFTVFQLPRPSGAGATRMLTQRPPFCL